MAGFEIKRYIHRADPFVESRRADREAQRFFDERPEVLSYYSRRGVIAEDGTFPFGEGHLYRAPQRANTPPPGTGGPGVVSAAAHRGSKPEQQDAARAARFHAGGREGAALVVADGTSSSGALAKPASLRAVDTFMNRIEKSLARLPKHESKRHQKVERAMIEAAFAANFEMVRQVLLDLHADGRFDAGDRAALAARTGVDLPTGPLTPRDMARFSQKLDGEVERLLEEGRSALATFATAIAVDDDLHTLTSGDAVVMLYRPGEAPGRRLIHLTHRDQTVVDLFREGETEVARHRTTWANEVSDCFGDAASMRATLRRYPNLLQADDMVIVCSDGVGPRTPKRRGLHRERLEAVLEGVDGTHAAEAIVRGQIRDIQPGEYQDNVSAVALTIVPREEGSPSSRWTTTRPSRVRRSPR